MQSQKLMSPSVRTMRWYVWGCRTGAAQYWGARIMRTNAYECCKPICVRIWRRNKSATVPATPERFCIACPHRFVPLLQKMIIEMLMKLTKNPKNTTQLNSKFKVVLWIKRSRRHRRWSSSKSQKSRSVEGQWNAALWATNALTECAIQYWLPLLMW